MIKRLPSRRKNELLHAFCMLPGIWALISSRELMLESVSESLLQRLGINFSVSGKSLLSLFPDLAFHPLLKELLQVWDTGIPCLHKNYPGTAFGWSKENPSSWEISITAVKDVQGEVYALLFYALEAKIESEASPGIVQNFVGKSISAPNANAKNEKSGQVNMPMHSVANYETDAGKLKVNTLFMDADACICILSGPDMVFEFVNNAYQQLFPGRILLGTPILEAMPELNGIPLEGILKKVYQTGDSFFGKEFKINLSRTRGGALEALYFNFIYQARRNELNQIDGIIVFAFEVTDMVLTRLEVQRNAQSLKTLVMAAHYGLLILRGLDLVVEVANAQILEFLERTADHVIGHKLMEVLPELAEQTFPELLRQVYESGMSCGKQEAVFYTYTAQGTKTKWVSFYYDPMLDVQGHVCGILVSAHEVTKDVLNRRLLEESLERQGALIEELGRKNRQLIESEMRFRASLEEAPVAIAMLKGSSFILDSVNAMMLKLMGRSSLALHQPLLEVIPELQGEKIVEILNHTFRTGETFSGTEQKSLLKDKKGNLPISYQNYIFKPLVNEAGESTSIMVVAIDVTEQVTARKELQKAVETLDISIKASDVGLWSYDFRTDQLSLSPRQKELFGFNGDEDLKGEDLFMQISDDQRPGARQTIMDSIEGGVPLDLLFSTIGYQDGRLRWLRSMGSLIRDEAGKPSFFSGVSIETTRQVQDDQRKNEFINIVSHELKTPLTSLKGYIQLLQQSGPEMKDTLKVSILSKAESRLDKMTSLINGFLNVSLLESGKIQLHIQEFDIEVLISEIIEETNLQSKAKNVFFDACESIMIKADRDKIGQVVSNLLSNAAKYAPLADTIYISCYLEEEQVRVSVRDKGVGIPEEEQHRIFERYYRVESAQNKHISGFGIGLYLCREIIHEHRGKIFVKSELEKGSTVTFCLPVAP